MFSNWRVTAKRHRASGTMKKWCHGYERRRVGEAAGCIQHLLVPCEGQKHFHKLLYNMLLALR